MSLGNEIRIGGVKAASTTGSIRAPSVGGSSAMRSGTVMERGAVGPQGSKGEKGDTGATGPAGADGISVTHRWNGTVLEVTSASGTSSADLKGEPGAVAGVKVAGVTHEPDGTGVVDLGDLSGGADLSDAAPADLGTAAAGTSELAARADHVHKMPTAAQVGAATAEEVSQLKDDLTAEQTARAEGLAEKLGKTETAADSAKLGGKTLAEIMLDLYPVGAVYISVNSTSPASLFGGTWEQLKDRFLLAAGSTYSAGSYGGEATHRLTKNELPYVDGSLTSHSTELISNKASQWYNPQGVFSASEFFNGYASARDREGDSAPSLRKIVFQFGGDQPHNNMPPYLAVYMWKRVS